MTGKIEVQALWEKNEDIAMHFNELLMKLRSQSLAGIAAVSTLVGIFTKEGVFNIYISWLVATAIFIGMAFLWVAIWCLDLLYYNRLLMGAISAIRKLEDATQRGDGVTKIEMSTLIEVEFTKSWANKIKSFWGAHAFYLIVLAFIVMGIGFCVTHDMRLSRQNPSVIHNNAQK